MAIKKLKDICSIKTGTTFVQNSSEENKPKMCPIFGGGISERSYTNIYNVKPETILINNTGSYAGFVKKYNAPVYATEQCFYLTDVNETVNEEYLYCYLKYNIQPQICTLNVKNPNKELVLDELANVEIEVPDLQQQIYIVNKIKGCNMDDNMPFNRFKECHRKRL